MKNKNKFLKLLKREVLSVASSEHCDHCSVAQKEMTKCIFFCKGSLIIIIFLICFLWNFFVQCGIFLDDSDLRIFFHFVTFHLHENAPSLCETPQ